MQIYKIDKDGYLQFGGVKIIEDNEDIPEGYTDLQIPKDEQGYQLPFYSLRLVGNKWIEDMAQEEIDALNNVMQEPTELEELSNYVLDVDFRVVMLEMGL